jgi:hypothetical protein
MPYALFKAKVRWGTERRFIVGPIRGRAKNNDIPFPMHAIRRIE